MGQKRPAGKQLKRKGGERRTHLPTDLARGDLQLWKIPKSCSTPQKINKEPENTGPLEEENHLPSSIIFRFYVNLRGCKFHVQLWNGRVRYCNFMEFYWAILMDFRLGYGQTNLDHIYKTSHGFYLFHCCYSMFENINISLLIGTFYTRWRGRILPISISLRPFFFIFS